MFAKLLVLALSVAFLPALVSAQTPLAKRRVAVLDFENAAVRGGLMAPTLQMGGPNLGQAVSELLINRLVNDGSYNVIERTAMDKVLAEQNLSNSDRTDAMTAARIGRVLGVDCIILGSITQYDYLDKAQSPHYNPLGSFVGGAGGSTVKHDITAKVQISARVVNVDTAEIVAVSQGEGEMVQKGVKVSYMDSARMMQAMSGAPGGTVMSDATDRAIAQLATQLRQSIARVPIRWRTVEGKVADVNGDRLILNVGSRAGVKVGDRLEVWRPGKPVRDPDTGKILRYDDRLIGEALVSSLDDLSAVVAFAGKDPAAVGDHVRTAK